MFLVLICGSYLIKVWCKWLAIRTRGFHPSRLNKRL